MKACYSVKSDLTRPQFLTAVKSQKQQPPQPCAFDTQLTVRTVPGLLAKQALMASPLNFERPQWLEHGLRPCSSETPVATFSKFAQISRAKRLKFSQKLADHTRFTQPGSQNAILERNAQITINF